MFNDLVRKCLRFLTTIFKINTSYWKFRNDLLYNQNSLCFQSVHDKRDNSEVLDDKFCSECDLVHIGKLVLSLES
eukprot:08163.XXX_161034_164458_1 [CDS] Oithona nana genome sequencing.